MNKVRMISVLVILALISNVSPTYAVPTSPAEPAKAAEARSLLQFTSGGHVLGFTSQGMYAATGTHALHVDFVNTNNIQPQAGSSSIVDNKAASLSRVTYADLWNAIDLTYTASAGSIYTTTYTLAPGADARNIRLRYNAPITLNQNGSLNIAFATGMLIESAPIAWQNIHGERVPVGVSFRVNAQEVTFALGRYDPRYALVIDPSLTWNTFLGGGGADVGYGIAVDGVGNLYVSGYSTATWSNPLRAYTSGYDAFVAKLDSSGMLTWNTFLGGNGLDDSRGISLDGNGNIYVVGYSSLSWGSPAQAFSGVQDAFTAKLDADGNLTWHSFLGGSGLDLGYGLAVDGGGNVYVTGFSSATWGSPLRAYTGSRDAFATKVDPSGVLVWNTFLGGSGLDYGNGIAVDGGGNVYIAGSSDTTWGSPVRAYSSGDNAYAAKLDSSGVLSWNTFLGASSTFESFDIAVDGSGNVYVTGFSSATWGSPIRAYTAGGDAFVAKLDSSGMLNWNTFLGGSDTDVAIRIKVDGSGDVYVTGWSNLTWGSPLDPYTSYDAFAAKLDSSGTLKSNTFLGGSGFEGGFGITVDGSGNVYVTGYSSSTWNSPVRPFAGGDYDAFVAKLDLTPQSSTRYVATTGVDTGDCDTWANACELHYALSIAVSGQEIWVAAGTHKPTSGTDRTATFTLKNGVAIYGGFAGIETLLSQRDPQVNVTTLSGDIGTVSDISDNSYHVVTGGGTDNTAILDGFTVKAGNANSASSPNDRGGGMFIDNGSPTLTNMTFSDNSAVLGGGMSNHNFSSPNLTNVTFSSNSAAIFGGGMFNAGNSSSSLTNVIFSGNTAGNDGGGIYNTGSSSPSLTNVTFNNNSAGQRGGGLFNFGGSPSLMNVTFSGNIATLNGGGMSNASSSPMLTNVTFSGNSGPNIGGGMYHNSGNPILTNVTFSGNSAAIDGGGMYNNSGNPILTNVTLTGNIATQLGGGIYNHSGTSLTMTNSTLSGNSVPGGNGGGIYNAGTLTMTNSTLSSNSAYIQGGGIRNVDTLNYANTVIANSTSGGDCDNTGGIIGTNINNLVEDGSCSASLSSEPNLGALADNGGPTQTMALLPGSPAIDAGDDATCAASPVNNLDQRGVTRPQGAHCDIGAYESESLPQNPVPSLSTINPASVQAGSPDFILSITGTNFATDAIVRWFDSVANTTTDLSTTYVSSSNLSAVVPSALLAASGTFEVSVFNPAPGGGTSTSLPFFVTQNAATISDSDTSTSTSPTGTAVASSGGSGPGTPGSLTTTATGTGTVTVALYDSNPGDPAPFTSTADFFDVYIAADSSFSTVTILTCNLAGFSQIYWWDGGNWVIVSPQSYDSINECVTMDLGASSSPTIADLTGTVFGVAGYAFTGFFQPVDNLPILNLVNGGRAIPVKFSLGGDQGLDIFASGYPKSLQISCDSTAPVDGIEETVTAGSSSLTYDPTSDQYHYVWKTQKSWANICRQLVVKFTDGTTQRANFKFK